MPFFFVKKIVPMKNEHKTGKHTHTQKNSRGPSLWKVPPDHAFRERFERGIRGDHFRQVRHHRFEMSLVVFDFVVVVVVVGVLFLCITCRIQLAKMSEQKYQSHT